METASPAQSVRHSCGWLLVLIPCPRYSHGVSVLPLSLGMQHRYKLYSQRKCTTLDCKLLRSNDFLPHVCFSFSIPTTVFYINVILEDLLIENILVVNNIFNIFISGRKCRVKCKDFGDRLPIFESNSAKYKPLPWADDLTSLCLSFLGWKLESVIPILLAGCEG